MKIHLLNCATYEILKSKGKYIYNGRILQIRQRESIDKTGIF
jgi:hypothetical protein